MNAKGFADRSSLSDQQKREFLRQLISKVRKDFYKTQNVTEMNEWIGKRLGALVDDENT